jgi:DNA invertase Pin-like site-specific DNA recombinase
MKFYAPCPVMRIGYARVSTDDQALDLQREVLRCAKCRHTYEEHASGKKAARPELVSNGTVSRWDEYP